MAGPTIGGQVILSRGLEERWWWAGGSHINLLFKGLDSKYVRLCGLTLGLPCGSSALQLEHEAAFVENGLGCLHSGETVLAKVAEGCLDLACRRCWSGPSCSIV